MLFRSVSQSRYDAHEDSPCFYWVEADIGKEDVYAGSYRYMEEGGDWVYPDSVSGYGMNSDGNVVSCMDGEPDEDGASGLDCTDTGSDSMEGWDIEDGSWL